MTGRVALYDEKLEADLLGTIIENERYRDEFFANATGAIFYDPLCARVFDWMLGRYMDGGLPPMSRDVFTGLMRDFIVSKEDVPRFFCDSPYPTAMLRDLTSLADARKANAATVAAIDSLSVNPFASEEIIGDLKRSLDEIDDRAGIGEHLYTWDELTPEDHPPDWVIPNLLDRDHVAMVTGPNGGGKSTLCLQLAIGSAIGIHPFTAVEMNPSKVLYIDAENSKGVVARKRRLVERMVSLGSDSSVSNIRFRFGGVNLADPADRLRLEHHMQSFEPDLVVLGPIYKMYVSGSDDSWRSEAQQVQTWVDRCRRKYNFGTLIEGHPPKGDGSGAPKGDSSWGSWPYFGFCISLDELNRKEALIKPWRFPREPVSMPERMTWGIPGSFDPLQRLPWSPMGPVRSSEEW